MILVENVKFAYDHKQVLEDITFTETEPQIIGLWGRNGAGKTTLMRLISGHYRPDKGKIEAMGIPPYNNDEAAKHICYIQERQPLGMTWTVRDALRFGSYYNTNWDIQLADHLLDLFRLDAGMSVHKLSKGMRSSLQFIIGLASLADVTILDEPIIGMDAGMRKNIYKTLRESHEKQPRLIVLSSHHIEEVQPICESLVVLHQGKLLFHQPIDKVREKGVWIAGTKEKVLEIVNGQKILEKNEAGPMLKAMLDVSFSREWKERANRNGLTAEKAKMQDYLLNITSDDEVVI